VRPERVLLLAVILLIAAAVIVGTAPVFRPAHAAIDPGVERSAVARGDHLYTDAHDYEGALAALRPALDADSSSYALLWRIARATTDRGARADFDGDKAKARQAFEQATRAARRAAALEPKEPEGHLELAVALGRLALHLGGKEKIRLSKEIKAEAERALELDPKQHRAHHILGRWNRSVATLNILEKTAANVVYGGLPKASLDDAVAHLEKAIELRPDYANHHLELGRTYLALKLKQKARAELEKAMACPPTTPFDADYHREAKKLLAEAGG
jgi:tetratricopeptide (TPR) repeat protein